MNAIQKLSRDLLAAELRRTELANALFTPREARPRPRTYAAAGTAPRRPARRPEHAR
jgi:hypothetical protein